MSLFSEPTLNQRIKNLRECLKYFGDLAAELSRIEKRRKEIEASLLFRRVLWSDPMTGWKEHGFEEMMAKVRKELDGAKIALHDAGPDEIHQCTPGARGFRLLKPGEVCDGCGFEQTSQASAGADGKEESERS